MATGYFPQNELSLTHVCFKCRSVAKGGEERKCPSCRDMMFCVGVTWKTPKRNDDKGWKKAFEIFGGHWRSPEIVREEWKRHFKLTREAQRAKVKK